MVASIFVPYIDHKRLAGNKTERWGDTHACGFGGMQASHVQTNTRKHKGKLGSLGASFGLQPDCVATRGKADDRSPWPYIWPPQAGICGGRIGGLGESQALMLYGRHLMYT